MSERAVSSGRLGPAERLDALRRAETEEFDLVVVGGGVVGAGVALDAATRGLDVALFEARDWASGTSSRSSKLIHGGLRYLEMLDFGLVKEALAERTLMLDRLAPHLVSPVPFLFPLTHHVYERAYVGAGVLLYDMMARGVGRDAKGVLPRHRHMSRRRALEVAPALRRDAFVGAVQYYDAQVDDARHTLTLVRTAAAHGAVAASRCQVVGLLHDRERVSGVRLLDLETREREVIVRARCVVNATGVWTEELQRCASSRPAVEVRVSKGIHLVVPRARIESNTGIIVRTKTSVLFVVPWGSHWIIGTTDTDWMLDRSHPSASRRDIEYLLGEVNRFLVEPLTPDDVEGVFAGLRPLLSGESDSTSKLSREHVAKVATPGLVVIAGGKYTTYRIMARDAVDAVGADLGMTVPESRTQDVPLLGAAGFTALREARVDLANETGLAVETVDRLLSRYGTLVEDIFELTSKSPGLNSQLEGSDGVIAAEVVYAASHEGAVHLEDVLTRRTRISVETRHRGTNSARAAADLMGDVLGWDATRREREVANYLARVDAERTSQMQSDDVGADSARLAAPDIAPLVEMHSA